MGFAPCSTGGTQRWQPGHAPEHHAGCRNPRPGSRVTGADDHRSRGGRGAMAIAIVFPGQGSQFSGMADPWTEHPAGQSVLHDASEAMGRDVVGGCRDDEALATTEFVQPAVLACDVAASRVLEAEGVTFGAADGHSLGEFAAVAAIDRAEELARSRGVKAIRLKVAGAFHSPLMQPAVEPIRAALAGIEFREARFPIVANVSGRFVGDPAALRDGLSRHVVSPVRWERSMHALGRAGFDVLVEAGPGQGLSRLAKRELPGVRVTVVGSPREAEDFARSISQGVVS